MVGPVLVNDVLNHLVATPVVEVNINIGKAYAVRIQKTFEQKVVGDRVDVGDSGSICDRRTRCRSPPRPHTHAHVACCLAEVLNDQKVSRIARALDGFKLKIKPLGDFSRNRIAPALCGAHIRQVPQVGVLAALSAVGGVVGVHKFVRNFKRGQEHVTRESKVLDLLEDFAQVFESLRPICKALAHLSLGSEVELAVGEPVAKSASAPDGGRLLFGLLDAEQHVVRLGLRLVQVERVVGGHRLDPVPGTKATKHVVDGILFRKAVAVDFCVKIGSKLLFPPQKRLFGLLFAHIQDQLGNLPHHSAGCDHDALFVGEQQVAVDARNIVKSIDVGDGTQLGQVVVARFVLGQQRNLESVVLLASVLVVAAHKRIHSHDGLELRATLRSVFVVGLYPLHELKRAHHVAEVGQRHCGLSVCRRTLDQFRNLCRRLQHAELAVHVQVKKRNICRRTWRRGGSGRNRFCHLCLKRSTGRLEVAVRKPDGRNHLRVGRDKILELRGLYAELARLPVAYAHEFPKASRGGLHVCRGIVGLCKFLTEELGMQFSQFGGLESAAPRNTHQRRRLRRHRIEHGLLNPRLIPSETQVLGPERIEVKLEVVPHHELRSVECRLKRGQRLRQRDPILAGEFGTNSVNLLGPKRNIKSLWPNQEILGLEKRSVWSVQLPSDLHHPRPIVYVAQRRIPIPW